MLYPQNGERIVAVDSVTVYTRAKNSSETDLAGGRPGAHLNCGLFDERLQKRKCMSS